MQLSRSYQLANPFNFINPTEFIPASMGDDKGVSFVKVVLGASVRGIGKDEYSTLGVVVVGRMLPYANAAAVAKAMAMTVSIQIKQMSINDFTHGSLLVDLSLASLKTDSLCYDNMLFIYYNPDFERIFSFCYFVNQPTSACLDIEWITKI